MQDQVEAMEQQRMDAQRPVVSMAVNLFPTHPLIRVEQFANIGPGPALDVWVEVRPRPEGEPPTGPATYTSWGPVGPGLASGETIDPWVFLAWPEWWDGKSDPPRPLEVVLHYGDVFGQRWETSVVLGVDRHSGQPAASHPRFRPGTAAPLAAQDVKTSTA